MVHIYNINSPNIVHVGTTMNNHIISFNQLVINLVNMDEPFKDKDLTLMLLGSLPKKFKFFKTTLLHKKADVSLSEVCVTLYSYELRKKENKGKLTRDTEALVVRDRSHIRSKLDDTHKQVEFEKMATPANEEVNDSLMVKGDSSRKDPMEERDSSEEEVWS
ncbi:hypothetical protein J1N35_033826 [Gossypium stocksii]|uniref:Retrovirus-related Pol polyprotein from transposon TNT 1-94 n=1 Tax=Gossypium stocksii TaxID=47602 RepID=A0A9D3ZNQ8_9ROSI|nr:hypothetical protein J1N35_033826 [Gossypium stocksii]